MPQPYSMRRDIIRTNDMRMMILEILLIPHHHMANISLSCGQYDNTSPPSDLIPHHYLDDMTIGSAHRVSYIVS